ncbi:MAG: DUF501 domain-containing protein [Mycobacteriales bacterium]
MTVSSPPGSADVREQAVAAAQLGRALRGVPSVAHRCPCGLPDVVQTAPILPDGRPFPTLYYLSCPRARSAVGRLESAGLMREMTARLEADPELRARYRRAGEDYRRRRQTLADQTLADQTLADQTLAELPLAGGLPDRVKCLHALVAHALAVGPGVNPFGDETLAILPPWWEQGPCVAEPAEVAP